eukprot:TRINITY_DN5792_c0_g1_i1.p1 TRINITY_DN5792_c0_g1~~TRINITY_DN5792_c0_g1_i1.p1  ORF type:complete len:500 (-),score=106.48 TRINITY_DN5792_c0_g1_i1:36-1535(-)
MGVVKTGLLGLGISVVLSLFLFVTSLWIGGPFMPPVCSLTGGIVSCPEIKVAGKYLPAFEEVVQNYKNIFHRGAEHKSQLSVWEGEENVIDLSTAYIPVTDEKKPQYDANSVQPIFTASKIIECVTFAMAVDKGLLKYEDLVIKYWPELEGNNKKRSGFIQQLKISDVLKDQAGLSKIFGYNHIPLSLFTSNNTEQLASLLQSSKLYHPGKATKSRAFHFWTRGIILNQILRRADPEGRSILQFFEQEIREPWNAQLASESGGSYTTLNIYYPHEYSVFRAFGHQSITPHPGWTFLNILVPYLLDTNGISSELKEVIKLSNEIVSDPNKTVFSEVIDGNEKSTFRLINQLSFSSSAELNLTADVFYDDPSVLFLASAKSLAELMHFFISAKTINGFQLVSKQTLNRALEGAEKKYDYGLFIKTNVTDGGFAVNLLSGGRNVDGNWFGFWAYGGSVLQFNIERQMSVAYTCTGIGFDVIDKRGVGLLEALDQVPTFASEE